MKSKLSTILLIAFVSIQLPIFAEAVLYPGVVLNYLKVPPLWLAGAGFFVAIILRFFANQKIWQKLPFLIYFVTTPLLTVLALALRLADILIHPNFSYTTFHIDPVAVGIVALYLALAGLPFLSRKLIIKNHQKAILSSSLLLYHLLITYWSNPPFFYIIEAEDGPIEYLTCLFYLLGTIFAIKSLQFVKNLKLSKLQKNLLTGLIVISALGMFVISAEEISWGQRILQIETPENLADVNTQGELNLHNHGSVFGYVYIAYLILNLFFLLNWLLYDLLNKKLPLFWKICLRLITSRWYLSLLFVPNLVYVILRLRHGNIFIDQWEEITEIYTAIGVALIWVLNFAYFKSKQINKNRSKLII